MENCIEILCIMIFATESVTYLFNMAEDKNTESCKPTE
jgi:hypothetical protein